MKNTVKTNIEAHIRSFTTKKKKKKPKDSRTSPRYVQNLRTQPTPIISPPAKNMKINKENEGCNSHKF
jgi:methyltransferase-like protein